MCDSDLPMEEDAELAVNVATAPPGTVFTATHAAVHYITYGDPASEFVVFCIHGLGAFHYHYEKLAAALAAAGFFVIVPDLYGFGFSDGLEDPMDYSAKAFVSQIDDIIVNAGVSTKPLGFVAHSMGGAIACQWVKAHPERAVAFLALLAPAGAIQSKLLALYRNSCGFVRSLYNSITEIPSMRRKAWLRGFAHPEEHAPELIARHIERLEWQRSHNKHTKTAVHTLLATFPLNGPDAEAAIAAVGAAPNVPVLLIWGNEDATVPHTCAERFVALIPHAQLRTYERVGHSLMQEAPDRLAEDVVAFAVAARSERAPAAEGGGDVASVDTVRIAV